MSFGLDENPREPAPVARHASHVDAKFNAARARCRRALIQSPELHYLGHYTEGAYDFSYDRLDGTPGQPDRMDYERIGVQITNAPAVSTACCRRCGPALSSAPWCTGGGAW